MDSKRIIMVHANIEILGNQNQTTNKRLWRQPNMHDYRKQPHVTETNTICRHPIPFHKRLCWRWHDQSHILCNPKHVGRYPNKGITVTTTRKTKKPSHDRRLKLYWHRPIDSSSLLQGYARIVNSLNVQLYYLHWYIILLTIGTPTTPDTTWPVSNRHRFTH